MKTPSIVLGCAGLGLLALAGWMATFPRPNPRPDLPKIAPFQPGERIALIMENPVTFPPADSLGLVQRARAAGADVRVFSAQQDCSDYEPHRVFQPAPWSESPTGYHPDQWPIVRSADSSDGSPWQILTLDSNENMAKNAAVVEAARVDRESGADDARGTLELQVLSRARRAELYRQVHSSTDYPALD
jgi:hypothetical protein